MFLSFPDTFPIHGTETGRFITELEKLPEAVSEFDDLLWGSLLEHVTVGKDKTTAFTLFGGTEIKTWVLLFAAAGMTERSLARPDEYPGSIVRSQLNKAIARNLFYGLRAFFTGSVQDKNDINNSQRGPRSSFEDGSRPDRLQGLSCPQQYVRSSGIPIP